MKLAIFDKDGTLTTPKSGAGFCTNPEDQMLLPGVAEGIVALAADGWAIAIVSNQGGVAAGHKSLEAAISEMRFCLSLLPVKRQVESALFCPDFEGQECYSVTVPVLFETVPGRPHEGISPVLRMHHSAVASRMNLNGSYRMPNPGMIKAAIGDHRGSAWQYLYVGDRPEAAAAAGVPFQWADEWRATHGPK